MTSVEPNSALEARLPALLGPHISVLLQDCTESGQSNDSRVSHDSSITVASSQISLPTTPPVMQRHLHIAASASPTSSFSSFFPWIKEQPAEEERIVSKQLSPRPVSVFSPPYQDYGCQSHVASPYRSPKRPLPSIPQPYSGYYGSNTSATSATESLCRSLERSPFRILFGAEVGSQPVPNTESSLGLSTSVLDSSAPTTPTWSSTSREVSDGPLDDIKELGASLHQSSSTLSRPGQDHESPSELSDDEDQGRATSDEAEEEAAGGGETVFPTMSTSRAVIDVPHRPRPARVVRHYHLFRDTDLPGYKVRREASALRPRSTSSCSASAAEGAPEVPKGDSIYIRTPSQLCGWKAVLMYAGKLEPLQAEGEEKQRKGKTKVLGMTAFEARQEPLKSHFDFRSGSGIIATMRHSNLLLRREWHIATVDGARLAWKMSRNELGLYLQPEQVQIAVFRKAPQTPDGAQKVGSLEITMRDEVCRRQSVRREKPQGQGGLPVDTNLILASLVAVFAARGGHDRISASYEEDGGAADLRTSQSRVARPSTSEGAEGRSGGDAAASKEKRRKTTGNSMSPNLTTKSHRLTWMLRRRSARSTVIDEETRATETPSISALDAGSGTGGDTLRRLDVTHEVEEGEREEKEKEAQEPHGCA
ncbi:hypothetical protein ACQY0O_006851 [Thecaphora frezii]